MDAAAAVLAELDGIFTFKEQRTALKTFVRKKMLSLFSKLSLERVLSVIAASHVVTTHVKHHPFAPIKTP